MFFFYNLLETPRLFHTSCFSLPSRWGAFQSKRPVCAILHLLWGYILCATHVITVITTKMFLLLQYEFYVKAPLCGLFTFTPHYASFLCLCPTMRAFDIYVPLSRLFRFTPHYAGLYLCPTMRAFYIYAPLCRLFFFATQGQNTRQQQNASPCLSL